MNRSLISKTIVTVSLSLSLLLVPGCKWFSLETNDQVECPTCPMVEKHMSTASESAAPLTGDVLVSVDGKPVMTVDSFEKDYAMVLDSNPQVKQLIELFPDMKDRIFEGLLNQKIIDVYIDKNKLNTSADYQQQLKEIIRVAQQVLNDNVFTKSVAPTSISDTEARNYYEQNKAAIPELIISRGGVTSKGVSFAEEEKARAFATKVKTKPTELESMAKEEGLAANFKDFKVVNNESVVADSAVRNKLLTLNTFPAVEVIKGTDGNFWVVVATSKEEPKYQPFEAIKEGLKPIVLQEKQQEVKQAKIEGLKKEYNVQINNEYFEKNKQQQKNDRMEKIQEAIQQQQQAQEATKQDKSANKPKPAQQQKPVKQQKAA